MKFNKWTLGLAALGVVSLASAVNAEEKTYLETAVSGTQISGYVNTSAHWNFNQGSADATGGSSRADGFNLDAVEVTIAKPLDESEWAAGYNFQLVYGQDAPYVGINPDRGGLLSIKQAYVELRAPVGKGIDIKMGLWDTILGYESFDAGNNPNYTRSYGYAVETTTYAGILASYKFCDVVSMQAGIANNPWQGQALNRSNVDSRKTYMGSVALTAPQSWGVLAGSTLYGAVAYGGGSYGNYNENLVNYYVGTVVNTGIKGLKVGAAYDYVAYDEAYLGSDSYNDWNNAIAVYASFQATDKLSFHARAEYAWSSLSYESERSVYAFTGTVQYDLWKNVLSRLEVRWDHSSNLDSNSFDSTNDRDAVMLAANIIYKF